MSKELWFAGIRSSRCEVFLEKGVLKICCKFIGEHPCRSVISKKWQSNFTEITLRHGSSPVSLQDNFRTSFSKNTPGRLLLIPANQSSFDILQLFDTWCYQSLLISEVWK